MQNKIALLISLIKINISRNKLIVKVPFSKFNLNILKILYSEGYIRGFKAADYDIYIYLKINSNKSLFNDICFFPNNNSQSYISYKKLITFFGLKHFAIISTNIVY